MSLSIEQLLDNIALRKAEDEVLWDAVIAFEEANGRLQHLTGRKATCQRLYDRVSNWLQEPTPNVTDAEIDLRGCEQLQNERGTGTSGRDALNALEQYKASVISMDAEIVNEPDIDEGEGTVIP